jgi:hypothetical protein
MNRQNQLACTLLYAVFSLWNGPLARGDDVPRQPWANIAAYPGKGLSPLYDEAGKELLRILNGNQRWAVLPRPINYVTLRPDRPPCFEMHNGDTYYNNLYGNPEAIRWAAEQDWDGEFRLLFNASLQAGHDNNLWLTIDAYQSVLRTVQDGNWRTYRTLGSDRFSRTRRGQLRLARAESGSWWMASRSGLFQLQKGTLRRERIADWPDAGVRAVVSDRQGRVIAWSPQDSDGHATVAFLNQGEWSTVTVAAGGWSAGAIRPDGVAVLAGSRRIHFVASPGSESSAPFAASRSEDDAKHRSLGQYPLDDDWIQPQSRFALSPRGDLLFVAIRVSDKVPGLVRVPVSGNPKWIKFADASRVELASMPDGDFLIRAPDRGMFRLAADSDQPVMVADSEEMKTDDRLLGCDHRGRVYIGRGIATLVFSADHEATPFVTVQTHAVVRSDRQRNRTVNSAAIDSTGRIWSVRTDGTVSMLKPGRDPELFDDRLVGAESLWPGRDGSLLVVNTNGSVSLVLNDGTIVSSPTLKGLASESFAEMLAAAPVQSCDNRHDLRGEAVSRRLAAPWLAIGDSLWISDGKNVDRLRKGDTETETKSVQAGQFKLMGPLRSGQLVLADQASSRITNWYKVDQPDGVMAVQRIGSPPAKQSGSGTLSRPESFGGSWLLDSQGWLWLHQGFDRVYRIESANEWSMLKDFGRPELEHPAGRVWGKHTARVFRGYEVGGDGQRRSCRPAYLHHLTPLTLDGNDVLCLTPTGLAWLRYDEQSGEGDEIVRAMPVNWRGTTTALIGLRDQTLWVVVRTGSANALVSVSLQEQ